METLGQFGQFAASSALFLNSNLAVLILIIAWSLAWKGFALWKAARLSHKIWFIIILIANTVGILEIIYIFFVARKYSVVSEIEKGGGGGMEEKEAEK